MVFPPAARTPTPTGTPPPPASPTTGAGTGKTTSQLQTPTAYGTGSSIYANWNLNLDGVTGNDDPWVFGTASQYPVLKYGGQTASQQRVTVTLTANPATIWERALTTPSRVNASTLTVTPGSAWDKAIVITVPTNASAYTLGASSFTFNAGSTTAQTTTMTAVNNLTDAANNAISLAITAGSPWVTIGTAPTVTINDDDELAKPTGVKLSVDGTKIRVDWTAVTGATGYKVQWNSTSSTSWTSPSEGTVSSGSTVTYTINPTPALAANTRYYVRVLPTKSGADEPPSDVADIKTHATGANATVDYDADNDGLIEITTLAQLNAVRWDLDGNGAVASGDQTNYDTAFPNAEDNMGCNESAVTIASNNTGNPACSGYELRANLDFDTDGDGTADSGDTYWNSGAGWTPIGDFTTAFTATFDGNTDTDASGDGGPYALSNLYVNATSTADDSTPDIGGLFGRIGNGGVVKNLGLEDVDVTVSSTLEDAIHVGALTADNRGTITGSWSTGSVTGSTDQNTKTAWISAGGLVGRNDKGGSGDTAYEGIVRASYSHAAVTGKGRRQANGGEARVGGLVGVNKGTITASYAAGNVTATNSVSGTELNKGLSGGLAGINSGTITASYARGDVSSGATHVTAGGLVGDNESGGSVTASFSTGSVTNTVDNTPDKGGLVGANAGSSTYSYWDTQTSGQSSSPTGTGKTTSQLQTPTAYGTGSQRHLRQDWNLNLDGVTGNDDPWAFGTASQYPVLKYGGQTASQQRVTVTLTASPTEIWERALSASETPDNKARVDQTTLTATPGSAWDKNIVVTIPTFALYTLSPSSVTIPAGSKDGVESTLTAVNNFIVDPITRYTITITAGSPWVTIGTAPTVDIKDDDELTKPTGVKLTVDGTKIRVDWTAVANATGYKVQWSTDSTFATKSEGTVSSGSTTNYTINPSTPLTANTRYYVRVLPTKSGADEPPSDVKDTTTRASAGTGDYDADNDGLIEISNLAQLNAVRWDLDGNGVVDDSANSTSYTTAFPNAEDNMGCYESAVTIASGPGNPACSGYELAANLDFDTGTKGTRTDDTYYNSGAGWDPIGGGDPSTSSGAYTAKFDGNSASYSISNLFIDRDATTTGTKYYAGLFGRIDTGAEIKNVKLTNVSVTLENTTTESPQPEVYAGGLVGYQKAGTVTGSSVVGTVKAVVKPVTPSTTTTNPSNAGGLVGYKKAGSITSSFARATVTAEQNASAGSLHAHAGGLTGVNDAGNIIASYSAGSVAAKVSSTNGNAYAGGLVGEHGGGDIKATYSYAATTATNSGSSNTSVSLYAAGLVAHQDGGNITASYSTGAPTIAKDSATVTEYKGGLVGRNSSGTTTDGYWDTEKSGVTATGQGTGKTGSELRTPTAYGTADTDIYKDWDIDLDSVTSGTQDGWDFGTNAQYPVLKYGLTPADQRVTATLSASPTTIWERALTNPSRVNVTTITATLSQALLNAVVVTLPTDADVYTLGSSTLTIAAGSTTATTTLTAVNNRVDAVNKAVYLNVGASADDPRVGVTSALATLTINDDDELAAPTSGTAFTPGNVPTTVRVQWNPVTNAAGYKIQYKLTTVRYLGKRNHRSDHRLHRRPAAPLCKRDITGFTVGSLYDFRVWATAAANSGIDEGAYATFSGGPGVDYDTDDDGLIEITTLAQLNAVRHDLDGDGEVENSANSTAYNTAFPSFKDNMGCEESKATPADRECIGYELKANLNFNTNGSATSATNPTGADSGDTYWNSGLGWDPIGGTAGAQYTALFDGNGDSDSDGGPYVISNLFIDRTSGNYAGLFAYLNGTDASDEVTDVALENVDITLNVDATDFVYVGALAGKAETDIISSYSTGEVNSATKITAANKYLFIGGLVGQLRDAGITASYSWADVTGNTSSSTHTNRTYSGGLVGLVGQLESASPPTTKIIASYAAGDVSAITGGGGHARAGGLAGQVGYGGSVEASYARGDVHGGAANTTNNQRGALAGYQFGNITASFATGKLTGEGGNRCGLVGYKNSGSITNSYYDSSNLGQTGCNSNNGTPKTTSELQTPTAYGTGSSIYANWNLNIDGNTGNDDPWDFGDANQYPALKYGGHTPADQRPTVDITASPTTIYEAVGGATSSTVTATLSTEWNKDVAVTIPAATDGLTVTNSPLSFTSGASGNWGTAQTATVALAADPGSGKTVVVDFTRLDVNDPEITPKYLTFTTSDWNTAQTVSLKFLAEPAAGTTRVSIQGTGNSKTYKVNLNAYRLPYDLGNPAVIVAEGATTGTETLTAQNDYNDLANATATLTLVTHPTDDDWISKGTGTAPSLTITDDDELGQVTGVSVVQKTGTAGNLAGGATVTWTKVTNATGYVIEWKSGTQIYDSSRRLVAGDVATYDVPASNLTPGTAYDIRVYATKSNSDHGLPSDEISFTYTGWLVFDKTQVDITELATGTQTGTYTVALSAAPSSNVTVNLSYRVPQMTLDPSTITFNSTNWNQWQPFTVEADQFPPRGTGRNDWTNVTFNDTSELDFRIPQRDTSTQGFIRHEKITFLVKLKNNPNTDKVVDLTSMYSVSVPSTHRITASPATLTFTTDNWNTPQTVTLSAPSDTHGIDEEETFVHTTVSTDLAYSGVKSMVSAKQIDSNSPPTSADFTRYIQTGRTMVNPGEPYFSFTDSDANDTKYAIIIESLPAAAQGALKRYRARQTGGRCRIFPNRPECGVIEESVYVGQILPTEDSKSSTAILLYFFPANGFSGASFTYRMVDNTGNISDAAYTVTLSPVGNVPAKPSGFTATPRNTKAQLSWTDPKDTTITKYEYSVINITDGGQWSNWTEIPCTSPCDPANLTSYTATNLTNKKKYQFRIQAVSLNGNSPPSEPRGVAPDILPAPSSLAATGDTADIDLTWDNPNNPYVTGYQIRQQEDNGSFTNWTDISGSSASTTAHSVSTGIASGKFYSFQIRAVDDVGPGTASASVKSALLPAKPTGLTATPGDTNVTLAWTDPANPTIDMWQYQEGSNPWKDATIGVTFGSSTLTFTPSILATLGSSVLTFTPQNWNLYQTVTVKLASQPPAGATTVTFNVPGAEFSPATLTFTPLNYNTNQNVQVKLTAAPQQDTDVSLTHPSHLVTSPQKWNVYQTVTVQLAAAPAATLDVAFNAPNLDFSPASLRFTPQNWNQNQSLRVKLNTPPLANTNVDMTSVYSVPWDGSTSYLVTGLVNTTNFTFKIRAVNIGGIGPASDGAATAPTDAPAKPTNFTVTPGVAQATLNWTAPNATPQHHRLRVPPHQAR